MPHSIWGKELRGKLLLQNANLIDTTQAPVIGGDDQ